MDVRWTCGVFISRAMDSNQNILALSDGSITRARAMTRIIHSMRWDADRRLRLQLTPSNDLTAGLDAIESEKNPHEHSSAEQLQEEPDAARANRRLEIDEENLSTDGYSKNCLNMFDA